jgi:RHS repeat-associated protein
VGLLNEGILEMSKNSVSSYSLSPYGETKIFNATGTDITATGSAISNTFFFQGRHLDSESGLYYFRNRYYSPELGRFISRDPIGYAGGDVNLYRFVGNGPYGGLDPMGWWCITYWTNTRWGGYKNFLDIKGRRPNSSRITIGVSNGKDDGELFAIGYYGVFLAREREFITTKHKYCCEESKDSCDESKKCTTKTETNSEWRLYWDLDFFEDTWNIPTEDTFKNIRQ